MEVNIQRRLKGLTHQLQSQSDPNTSLGAMWPAKLITSDRSLVSDDQCMIE